MLTPLSPPHRAAGSNPSRERIRQGRRLEERAILRPSSEIGQRQEDLGVGPELKSEIGKDWAKDLPELPPTTSSRIGCRRSHG